MIAQIALWTGIVASAITIIGLILSPRWRELLANLYLSNRLAHFRRGWSEDSLNKAILRAKQEVSILQTWIPSLNTDISDWESVMDPTPTKPPVRFRALLAGDEIVKARLQGRPTTVPMTDLNLRRLTTPAPKPGMVVEVRLYNCLPFGPIYIVDDVVYWGIFLANRDSLKGPRFKTSRTSYIGNMIVDSFESVWNSPSTVTPDGTEKPLSPPSPQRQTTEILEIVHAEVASHQFQRECDICNTWLHYHTTGAPGSQITKSFCSNPNCSAYNKSVEIVPLSL